MSTLLPCGQTCTLALSYYCYSLVT
jgi:hypothetical protein